jgi:pimeloyl-ACP methyl ester carboxylesterase
MSHPVVLIHGMWCTGANLAPVAAGLSARGFKCHLPTLPAHEIGVAHPEVGCLGLSDYVEFLEQWIDRQQFSEPPILLGHSMGGLLAQLLAARLSTRQGAFALVLLTPASPAGINAIRLDPLMAFAPVLARPGFWNRPHRISKARASRYACAGVPKDRHAALYDSLVDESGRVVFEIALWPLDPNHAARIDPEAVRCPVYVVSGGLDGLTPAAVVRKVAARYPGAALRHYPQRGHWVIDDDQTDAMCGEIAAWLLPLEQRAARGLPLRS